MNLYDKHMALVDAVNDATTREAHREASVRLYAWREGCRDAGRDLDLTDAEWHSCNRYGFGLEDSDPPMCAGVRLDWSPDGYPSHSAVVTS